MGWTAEAIRRNRARAHSKQRDALEISIAYVLILSVIWTPKPLQSWLWWVAAATVTVITVISWEGLDAMGLRRRNFLRSLWVVGAAIAVAAIAVAFAARLHTLDLRGGLLWLFRNFWLYSVWSAAQQFLLQCFFLLRLLRLLPRKWMEALAAAVLFSLAHMPNFILVTTTFAWGFLACLLFIRYRNLYPLALAHAILGIMIAVAVPGTTDHNMRVGLGYLRYNPRIPYRHHSWIRRSPQP